MADFRGDIVWWEMCIRDRRHRGRKTECEIDANGVLTGTSKKVYRGTIDLVHGCKGCLLYTSRCV